MKYKDMNLQELRYSYLTALNDLEKEILAVYGKYRKYQETSIEQLRDQYRKADDDDKAVIAQVGKKKTAKKNS